MEKMEIVGDFKSLVPNIPDAKTLHQFFEEIIPLANDGRIGKPLDDTKLSESELSKFKIDLEKWDRLYYVDYSFGDYLNFCRSHGRIKYNGKNVYFEIYFHYCEDYISRVHVFASADVNLFMISVFNEKEDDKQQIINLIRQSLNSDGIHLDENIDEFIEYYHKMIIKQYPFHNGIPEDFEEYFKKHADILPKSLIQKKDDFKKFITVKNYYEYDEWYD